MTHVFEGEPDGRQSMDPNHRPSRFRPTYRPLTDDEKALHDEIKAKAVELEALIDRCALASASDQHVDSRKARYVALAMTNLELAVMWAVKALTS